MICIVGVYIFFLIKYEIKNICFGWLNNKKYKFKKKIIIIKWMWYDRMEKLSISCVKYIYIYLFCKFVGWKILDSWDCCRNLVDVYVCEICE